MCVLAKSTLNSLKESDKIVRNYFAELFIKFTNACTLLLAYILRPFTRLLANLFAKFQTRLNNDLNTHLKNGNSTKVKCSIILGAKVHGDELRAGQKPQNTPIHQAVESGDLESFKYLISCGCGPDVNRLSIELKTPLHVAVEKGHTHLIRPLLDAEAEVNAVTASTKEMTPLQLASQAGQLDTVKALIDFGAKPSLATKHGETPLCEAVKAGKLAVAEFLLSQTKEDLKEPTLLAAAQDHLDILNQLKEVSAKRVSDIDTPSLTHGENALSDLPISPSAVSVHNKSDVKDLKIST